MASSASTAFAAAAREIADAKKKRAHHSAPVKGPQHKEVPLRLASTGGARDTITQLH
jgi:hypothetical protein